MASILVWDGYGKDLHRALEGVMENVRGRRWRAARYAVGRRWFVDGEEEESVWIEVAKVALFERKRRFGKEEDMVGWESVMLETLSLPLADGGEGGRWTFAAKFTNYSRSTTSLLHAAVTIGSEKVVEWVVENGGDLEVKDYRNRVPLWLATEVGCMGVVGALVEGGADVGVRNSLDRSLLFVACQRGRLDVVEYLLGVGEFDVDEEDMGGVTLLGAASQFGHMDIVKMLVEKEGAGVDVEGEKVKSPILLACEVGHTDVVTYLLGAGAWSRVDKTEDGCLWVTALMAAVVRGFAGIVDVVLAETGVDADRKDEQGNTALIVATGIGYLAVVRVLLERGADVNLPVAAHKGKAPLHLACENRNPHLVGLLLDHGADPCGVVAADGNTPYDVAVEEGGDAIISMLEEEMSGREEWRGVMCEKKEEVDLRVWEAVIVAFCINPSPFW